MATGTQVLVPPDSSRRRGKSTRPGWDGGLYAFIRCPPSSAISTTAKPSGGSGCLSLAPQPRLFSKIPKFNRKMTRFHRRGRAAARTEWRLITATHNLRG
jgi:hypothetical protein